MTPADWTIIVVEDTFDDQQLASAILSHSGIDVRIAQNGRECIDLLDQIDPTLIVTDLAMPDMDGWEMLKALRSNTHTDHIPVVAVTAYDSVDVAHDAQKAGFNGYFAKPISPRKFVDQLNDIITSLN